MRYVLLDFFVGINSFVDCKVSKLFFYPNVFPSFIRLNKWESTIP